MADAFFDFGSTLKNGGEHLLPPADPDDYDNEEEEYDALNDETFGALDDGDWEEQHEQFAERAETTRHSQHIENSLSALVLDDDITFGKSAQVWAYNLPKATPPPPAAISTHTERNGDFHHPGAILSSLQRVSRSFIENHVEEPKKFCTVEELEKNLIKSQNTIGPKHQGVPSPIMPPQQHMHLMPRPPPGLPPLGVPPPGMIRLPGPIMQQHQQRMMMHYGMMGPRPNGPPPPGMMFNHGHPNHNHGFQHPYGFPPPQPPAGNNSNMLRQGIPQQHLIMQQQQQQHRQNYMQQQQHQQQHKRHDLVQDEYAGLMTMREKQWLLNIQIIQLNTGTPYFDDYYYTVFKERQNKLQQLQQQQLEEHSMSGILNHSSSSSGNNGRMHLPMQSGQQRHNNRQQQQQENTLTPRIYTPLQFENSLGKLQCGSVTAPRKIIDMDVVTQDKDKDEQLSSGLRKTKQLLLELEALYTLLLKAEDLSNPLAISNADKLREIKQKQRLRELELAQTADQKTEILRIFKQESEPLQEHAHDYIARICLGFLQDDKLPSFLTIRKGKMLLLRLLPHLTLDQFGKQLNELWRRLLVALPIIGRRDQLGDNLLPKLHAHFKVYVRSTTIVDVLEIAQSLLETVKVESGSRATPSLQQRPPLYFALLNRFGVSALILLFIRTEYLITTSTVSDKQLQDWANFLQNWAEQSALLMGKLAVPEEAIPAQIFLKHSNRFPDLPKDKLALLQRHFVTA